MALKKRLTKLTSKDISESAPSTYCPCVDNNNSELCGCYGYSCSCHSKCCNNELMCGGHHKTSGHRRCSCHGVCSCHSDGTYKYCDCVSNETKKRRL